MGYDDDIPERLRRELEYQNEQRRRSNQKGKQSFLDWLAELLKSAFNTVGEIVSKIGNWLWELLFGDRK